MDVPLAPVPQWVLDQAAQGEAEPVGKGDEEWWELFDSRVQNGGRNNRCAVLSGYLLRKFVSVPVVERLMLDWNALHCQPALSAGEVRAVVRSIEKVEARRRELYATE